MTFGQDSHPWKPACKVLLQIMCPVPGTRMGGLQLAGFVAPLTGLLAGFREGAVIAEVRGASATPKEACSARAVASEHAH